MMEGKVSVWILGEIVQAATFAEGLRQHVLAWQPVQLITMAASEYAGRRWQQEQLAGHSILGGSSASRGNVGIIQSQ